MKNPVKSASATQSGKSEVYYHSKPVIESDDKGVPHYELIVAGKENASDYVTLMRYLPELFQDAGAMSEILGTLLSLTAKQQMQISALEAKIEDVVRANIAIQAQENINKVLFQLAAEGCDVVRPEVIIKIAASMSDESSESTKNERTALGSQSAKREMQGEISGVAKLLTGLKLSGGEESSLNSEIREIFQRKTDSAKSNDYTGDVVIRFESISGSPMAKAKADVLKVKSKPKAKRTPTERKNA